MKPFVTALIDTYSHEKYIEQAIVSVLEQGLSAEELEIVVVDDGSTDGTASIVEKFAPRVRLVRKKNGGQASAFNAGFGESHGEIIALLDGDDWWGAGKLETVLKELEAHPELGGVSHGYYEFHERTQETIRRVPPGRTVFDMSNTDAIKAAILEWRFLLMGGLTVRRKVMEWIVPVPETMKFNADMAIQAAAVLHGTLILEQPLMYYRHHGDNLYAGDAANEEKARRRARNDEASVPGTLPSAAGSWHAARASWTFSGAPGRAFFPLQSAEPSAFLPLLITAKLFVWPETELAIHGVELSDTICGVALWL